MSNVIEFSDKLSEEIMQGICLVDFYADWCMPCRMLFDIISNLADSFSSEENVSIGKLNIDSHSSIAKDYNVSSLPTIIIFKDGVEQKRAIGLQTESDLESWIRDLM